MKKVKKAKLLSFLLAGLLIFGSISSGIPALAASLDGSYTSETDGKSEENTGTDTEASGENKGTSSANTENGTNGEGSTEGEGSGENKESDKDENNSKDSTENEKSDADVGSGEDNGSDKDTDSADKKDSDKDKDEESDADDGSGKDEEPDSDKDDDSDEEPDDEGSDADTDSDGDESKEDEESEEDDASEGEEDSEDDEVADDGEGTSEKDEEQVSEEGKDKDEDESEDDEEDAEEILDWDDASPSDAIQLFSTSVSVADLLDLEEDGIITLTDDFALEEVWKVDGEYTLDLNGYNLTNDGDEASFNVENINNSTTLIYISEGSILTIIDSGNDERDGKIISTLTYAIAVDHEGEVTIDGVEIENDCNSCRAVYGRGATIEIDDSTVIASGDDAYAISIVQESELNIADSNIQAEGNSGVIALRSARSQVEISNSELYGDNYGIYFNNGSKIKVNGGTVQSSEDSNGVAFGIFGDDEHDTTELTINAGEFSGYNVIYSNSNQENINININGGYLSSSQTAIYLLDDGTLNLKNGVIESETNGINIRNGSINISGGVIKAFGNIESNISSENGLTGIAVLIEQHVSEREIDVEISGGEFWGKLFALYEQDNANDKSFNISITGGIFASANQDDEHPVEIKDQDDIDPDIERMISITGGFYSNHVEESEYIDDGYMCIDGITVTGDSGDTYTDCHVVVPDTISDSNLTFSYSPKTFTYNGTAQVPAVSDVKLGDVELIEDKQYTVTYEHDGSEITKEDVIEAGTYTVVVSGTGSEAMCSFDAAGGEHTKDDGLTGSVSGEFEIQESNDNPDDGNPDDGNPDDGNPDDGNPDTGNPDSGSHHSSGGGGGGSSSTGSGTIGTGTMLGSSLDTYTDDSGRSGHWIMDGIRFLKSDGTYPSNEYLNIDGEIWRFSTNGYAVDRSDTQYYSDEAIAAAGMILPAAGAWVSYGWWFRYSDGSYPRNEWKHLTYNGKSDWYFFDEDGWMVDGWLNWNGNTYYLHAIPDGDRGYMYVGWNEINGQMYYFSEDEATLGALIN